MCTQTLPRILSLVHSLSLSLHFLLREIHPSSFFNCYFCATTFRAMPPASNFLQDSEAGSNQLLDMSPYMSHKNLKLCLLKVAFLTFFPTPAYSFCMHSPTQFQSRNLSLLIIKSPVTPFPIYHQLSIILQKCLSSSFLLFCSVVQSLLSLA